MEQSELRAWEEKCIQECAPPCAAACPLHVDVRAVALEVGRGDLDAASKALRRTVPFPGIVGRVCEQPCRPVCKRGEAGEPIAIAALERACADHGTLKAEKTRALPKRNHHVVVVGGGLSGALAAHDLARKGYTVCLYEALDPVGGSLWSYPEEILPHALVTQELSVLETLGIEFHLNTRVGADVTLDALREEHEAVYLALGASATETFGLELDERGRVKIDPVTYTTSRAGVFAGGNMIRGPEGRSAIQSLADGRRAAISIDRYLQHVSLTASRSGEGSQTSCLYTRTDDVAPLPLVPMASPADGYTRPEALREAQRCLQCQCLECVKVCEYLEHYGRYPRKYVREVYNNLSIVQGTRTANRFINSCSLCGLCAAVCPTDLDMGAVNKRARQLMVAQGRMPPSAHDFALRDMAFSQSEHFALARNAPGADASDYVFFPGCQLAASTPSHVRAVYDYLGGALPDARLGLLLGCCGAPADWAGRTDLAAEVWQRLRAGHEALGWPKVVLACSSCHQVFRQSLPEIEVVLVWDLLVQHGLPARDAGPGAGPGQGQTVSVHDPCTTRQEAGLHANIRALLTALGYHVAELPRSQAQTTCCGFGGGQWLANPEVTRKVVARRVQEGPADYVTYCAMCRDVFACAGKRTLHLLDLVFGRPGQPGGPGPTWSQRHENRARVKRHLLKDIWGETMDGQAAYESI